MKLILLSLLICTSGFADTFDENLINKIPDADPNVVKSTQNLIAVLNKFTGKVAAEEELPLLKKFVEAGRCTRIFGNEIQETKYKNIQDAMKEAVMKAQIQMGDIASRHMTELAKLEKEKITKSDDEICGFKIHETQSYMKQKKETETWQKEYEQFMAAKTEAHPLYVLMIEDLEKLKDSLKMGMSSQVKLEPGNYEKNFVTFAKVQFPYNDLLAKKELARALSECKLDHVAIYEKNCKGQKKFEVIPYENVKGLACMKDDGYLAKCPRAAP